jgi:hypothetical protein
VYIHELIVTYTTIAFFQQVYLEINRYIQRVRKKKFLTAATVSFGKSAWTYLHEILY